MKKFFFIATISIFAVLLFNGCSPKATIEPLVSDCCETKDNIKINKNIYIGNIILKDINNLKNIYGIMNFNSNFGDIVFEESYNDIFRKELFKRLQKISNNVYLVNQKPNQFNENDSIYIEGYIEKIWINQQIPINKTKFNTNSIFDFKITSIVNGKPISDNFNAKLELSVQDIQIDSRVGAQALSIIVNGFLFADASEATQNIKHKLTINNELIADFNYFQFLENQVGNFTTDYEVAIKGNIYGKYPQRLDDYSKGNINKFAIFNMAYSYFSFNLYTSPGYNLGFDNYLSKDEIKKIKEEYDLQKKDFDECEKNKKLNEDCMSPMTRNIENTKYYDIFRLYATNSGILQYMINDNIDKIIDEINKK